jgi:TfuA protein
MEKPVIFLGPSLSHEKARKIFDADYRPPAKKGDFLRLAADPAVRLVGFVDGVFLQDYPPTPIEVYQLARREGILLAGAASLGALRAVELEKFGMVGIGKIFQLYKSGKVDADDEVAVTFAPDGDYRLQSEAMIDIRYNLFLAHRKGVIDKSSKRLLARVAKETYFPHRNYAQIIEDARGRYPNFSDQINSFGTYVGSNRKSLKEIDAIRLVKYLKEQYEGHDGA